MILKRIAKSKNIKHDGRFLQEEDREPEGMPLAREAVSSGRSQAEEGTDQGDLVTTSLSEEMVVPATGVVPDLTVLSGDSKGKPKAPVKDEAGRKYTILDLFKTRVLIRNTLLIFFLW